MYISVALSQWWGQPASALQKMRSSCYVYLNSTVFGILYNLHLHNVLLCKRPWGEARVSLKRELSNLSYVNPQHYEHWAQAGLQHSIWPCILMARHVASETALHLPRCLSLPWLLGVSSNSPLHVIKDTEEYKSTLNCTNHTINLICDIPPSQVPPHQLNITLLLWFCSKYLLQTNWRLCVLPTSLK